MNEQMEFPETFEKFAEEYGFRDYKEVYTNGLYLIPIFRVKQWLEHDNKLRRIEIDTAYECGKYANKWIPVSEELSKDNKIVIASTKYGVYPEARYWKDSGWEWAYESGADYWEELKHVTAWMPLPEPYEVESEDKE